MSVVLSVLLTLIPMHFLDNSDHAIDQIETAHKEWKKVYMEWDTYPQTEQFDQCGALLKETEVCIQTISKIEIRTGKVALCAEKVIEEVKPRLIEIRYLAKKQKRQDARIQEVKQIITRIEKQIQEIENAIKQVRDGMYVAMSKSMV